jgi:hypothetical protein
MTNIPTILSPVETMCLEFMETFKDTKTAETRINLCEEENAEVKEAAVALLKEICDLIYVSTCANLSGVDMGFMDEPGKYGLALQAMGWFPNDVCGEAFKRVHESNMSKLVDGKPLLREDGKILKGKNYKPPYLLDLIA